MLGQHLKEQISGKKENAKPEYGEDFFWDINLAPCSNSLTSKLRRVFERVTTFVLKIFSRKS